MKQGTCAICGLKKTLTFEHIPPKKAFNSTPKFIHNYENLYDETSNNYGKRSKSNVGFGGTTLCQECNSLTGSWYGNSFVEFAKLGMTSLLEHERGSYWISGNYKIKPLRVLKQIVAMHLSADKSGKLRLVTSAEKFVLDKSSALLDKDIRVFLYSTLPRIKRFVGYSDVFEKDKHFVWSEICFEPFGYFLTIGSDAPQEDMFEITDFKNYQFDEEAQLIIKTPFLEVTNDRMGDYFFVKS